jgi:large subunit ribosomal protein L18
MKTHAKPRLEGRKRRHMRIRRKVSGTAERPRLTVFRSLNHIYAQLVDDLAGRTVLTVSSRDKDLAAALGDRRRRP